MKLHLILLSISFLIFGGGIAAGVLWNMDMYDPSFSPFPQTGSSVSIEALPVPQAIVDDFSKEFSAIHTAQRASVVDPDLAFMSAQSAQAFLSGFYGGAQDTYVLLNLWATWCPPCVVELPYLEELEEMYADKGLNVIAVSVDHARGFEDIRTFLNTRGVGDFALYFDDQKMIRNAFPARGLPTTYLISPKGEILYVFEGDADWAGARSLRFFDALLSARAP